MRKCLLTMLILMLIILLLILVLLNLNTGYADIDADLCIRIMSLCCASFRVTEFMILLRSQTFYGSYRVFPTLLNIAHIIFKLYKFIIFTWSIAFRPVSLSFRSYWFDMIWLQLPSKIQYKANCIELIVQLLLIILSNRFG